MPPKAGAKKSKAAKMVTNKRRRGFIDPDLRTSKKQQKKDDAKFVRAKFGNIFDGKEEDRKNRRAAAADAGDGSDSDGSYVSSDDEDARNALGRKPPKVRKRHFKTFAERVGEVDVDVHRTTGELRTAPIDGSSNFLHETLLKWQELNCGADFGDFGRETMQLCQSLPQLVLHQNQVLDALLAKLRMDARHSLEALLACLSSLARDLRADFLTRLGDVTHALSRLLMDGAEREPELLEYVFACLARVLKWTQRQLAADLPLALRHTRSLRRHRSKHVRLFAAQAAAFLLRAAPDAAVEDGVRALIDEATSKHTTVTVEAEAPHENDDGDGKLSGGRKFEERTRAVTKKEMMNNSDAAGSLLAEAMKGAAHGLHSRAPRLLTRVLRPGLMTKETSDEEGDGDDTEETGLGRLARAYAVAEGAIDSLAKHTRRGKCGVMWTHVMRAARRACAEAGGEKPEPDEEADEDEDDESEDDEDERAAADGVNAAERAARSLGLVATAVEVYNGARVEDYEPIFNLIKRSALPALKKAAADESEQTLSSLSSSTHRLCLACVDAHNKVAGASRGPESITRAAGDWGVALAKAPPGDAFVFVSSLRQRAAEGAPAAAAALSALLPAVAPAIARLLNLGWSGDTGEKEEEDARGGSSVIDADAAAGLLGDVCDVLSRDGHLGTGEALVLSAAPKAAAEIAARCESSSQGSARKGSKQAPGPPARRRWALLRVLPHCADIHGVRRATGDAIAWALQTLGADEIDGLPAADASYASVGTAKDAAAVLAAATAARAAAGPEPSDENVDAAIAAASALSAGEYPAALSAAADLLAGASDPNAVGSFMDAVAAHQSSLKSPSRHMRVGALRYLCAVADAVGECDADDARAAGANDTPANLAECLHRWLKVNEVDVHDTSNGPNVMEFAKTAQVSIAAIRRAVEQEVLGAECAQTLATCGLGALHIRLASVWPETYKLFGALTERKEFELAWTVLFDDLNEYQVLCLDAHDAAAISAAEHGRKKGEWRDGEGGGEGRRDDAHANAAAEALQRRMENETVPTEQGTERWQRLGLLLRSVASSPPAASRHPAPLAKLFLAFNAPKPDGNRRAGKAWRAGLREWLKVIRDGLSGGKAVRAMTGTGDAVRVILERCVGADEPDLAQLAVRCLGQWRLPHLTADNADRLARVADPNTMKDELISMRVEPGETEEQRACVEPEHRPAFASLVVRCLLPRLKRRTGRFAPHRVAALRWIGKLDPSEIVPLIHSVISPMEPTAVRDVNDADVNDAGEDTHGMMVPNTNTPWLDALVVTASGAGGDAMANAWLQLAKDANVSSLVGSGSKVPSGFLRAAGDLLKVMAEHTKAYLHPLMSLTVEMLGASSEICETAARSREARRTDQIEPEAADDDAVEDDGDQIEPEDDIEDVEGEAKGVIAPGQAHRDAREVRVLAVRLLGALFERHPDFDYSPYWTAILLAVRPMAERMPAESAAPTPPPALAIVAALADDDALAPLLESPGAESLLTQLWRALGAPFASPATRAAALAAAESLIERAEEAHWARKRREGDDDERLNDTEHVSSRLLRAHAPALLDALQAALAARAARGRRAQTPGSKIAAATEKGAARNAGVSSGSSGRELAVLKRLGPLLGRAAASAAIADTLVPVLALRRLDENAASEVLGALAAVVPPPDELREDADRAAAATAAARHRSALAPLFGRLRSRSARKALCHAWNAIGRHDVAADACDKILNDFHADAKNSIDGIDYDTRLGAYDLLTAEWFLAAPPASSVPVLNHVIHELRGADMALRHAAAAALGRFLDAAVRSGSMSGDVKVVDDDDDDEDDEVDAEADDEVDEEDEGGEKDGDDDSGERKAKAPTDAVDADDFDPVAGMSTAAERAAEAAKASEASLAGAVAGVLAPGIRGLLRSPEATTRQEAIACFRRLALSWPSAAPGAATLADDADGGEHDFFSNMGHLQAHRRCRALRKMAKACEDGAVPFATINGYLAPLAVASLGDGGADVASTAAAAIGSLAAALPWASYRDLLLWMLRKAGGNRAARRGFNVEGSKALHIRAAATVLESFHEFETETETLSGVGATNVVGRSIHPAVVATLRADILPHLEKLTVVEDKEGKGGTVRPAASAAVVSLLRLLPEQDLNFDIGRVLGKIANCLRSRAQGVRDSARTALAVAAKGLGCKTLPQVVALLSNRLDRGFMTHVLGATLFSLVDACVHGADPMDVENALDEIVPLLDADLFGRAAEERTVDAIRGAYQEAKRCRSHEVLAILAANAPCPSALPTLLSPVTRRLHTAHVPALKRQIEACLASVQKGVLNNKHAVPEETLVLVHSVVNDGISQEERQAEYMEAVAQGHLEDNQLGARRRGEKETGNRVWERGWYLIKLPAAGSDKYIKEDKGPEAGDRYKKAKYGGPDSDDEAPPEKQSAHGGKKVGVAAVIANARSDEDVPPNFDLLVTFALGLLRALLRKMSGEKGVGGGGKALGEKRESILEGVVPLAVRALSSRRGSIPPLAVRCLAQLSTMKLAAFDSSTGALARRIMALLRECSSPNEQLAQDCLKLLNNLLKRHTAFTPTDAQFRFIITFAFGDLEGDHREEQRSTTFSLMRAVLARRPLLPEVYDCMKTVSSLVVRANAKDVRELCAQALVQFLLDYPLGERRLQQHLEALAANLEYQHASGRLSAMNCLRDVVARFPAEAVEAQATFLFVPMVARLGADEDAACRRAAGEALTTLLKRVAGTGAGRKLLALAVGWCAGSESGSSGATSDPRLRRAAMQTLGLAVTAAPKDAARAVAVARPHVASALHEHDPEKGGDDDDDDATVRGWQTAYYALLLVEKAAASCPKALSDPIPGATGDDDGTMVPVGRFDDPDAVWSGAQALLLHRHQWVQHAAARVVGHRLASHGSQMASALASGTETNGPIDLERVARCCVAVLEQGTGGGAVEIDDGLAEQTVKNLTFATVVLLQTATNEATCEADADDDEDDAEGGSDKDEDTEEKEARPPYPWLFRRMGKVGAGGVGAARAAALRWSAATAASLGSDGFAKLPACAPALLLPAVLCADVAVKNVDEAHRDLAAEALEVMRATLPADAFGKAFAKVQRRITERRDQRRKMKALEAVTDPEKAARARLVKNGKRAAARKRKIQEYRGVKGTSQSTKKRAREV